MKFVFVGGSNQSTSNTQYNNVVGGSTWSYLATRQQVVPCYAEFNNFRCVITSAPGGANSNTFTIYKNGAATPLSVVISGTSTMGSDNAHTLTVNAGDTVAIYNSRTGSANASRWSLDCNTSAGPSTSFTMATVCTSQPGTAPYYIPIIGGKVTVVTDSRIYRLPMPLTGTFTAMVAKTHVNVGSGSLVATLMKNSVATSLACTINAGYSASTCNANVTFVPSDLCVLRFSTIGAMDTSISASVGMVMNASSPGQYIAGGATPNGQSTWYAEQATCFCASATTWAPELGERYNLSNSTVFKNIYYIANTQVPGAGSSVVYAMNLNGVNCYHGTISGTSSVTATVADLIIPNLSNIEMRCWVGSGTPNKSPMAWTVMGYQLGAQSCTEADILTDSISKRKVSIRNLSEPDVLTDSINKITLKIRSLPVDTATLTDTISRGLFRTQSASNSITLADSCQAKITGKLLFDGPTLTDLPPSKSLRTIRILSESNILTDTPYKRILNSRSDIISLTDSVSKKIVGGRTLSDTFTLSDQVSEAATGIASTILADNDVLTDNKAIRLRVTRIPSESAVLFDSQTRQTIIRRTFSESLMGTDQPTPVKSGVNQSIFPIIFPFVLVWGPSGKFASCPDTLVLTDTVSRKLVGTRTLNQILDMSSQAIVTGHLTTILAETPIFVDSQSRRLKSTRTFSESIVSTDLATPSGRSSTIIAEADVLTDSVSRKINRQRSVSESDILIDTLYSRRQRVYLTLSEFFQPADYCIPPGSGLFPLRFPFKYAKSPAPTSIKAETVVLTESLTRKIRTSKSISESPVLTDQWSYGIISRYKSTILAESNILTEMPSKHGHISKTLFDGPVFTDGCIVPLAPIVTAVTQRYLWQLNDVDLPDTYVTARKINSPWASSTINIYAQKAVVTNPNQLAQPITISITIVGNERYSTESSIRAELEKCRCVQLKTVPPDYIYDDVNYVLFEPQSFAVEDSNQILKCRLNGFIDDRTLTTGNHLVGWSTVAGSPSITNGSRFGKNCFKSQINDSIGYTFPAALDMARAAKICFWLKCDLASSSLTSSSFYIYSGIAYYGWEISFPANVWTYIEVDMAQPDSYSTPAPDLTQISQLRFALLPNNQTKYVYLSWISMN
jgi:hypothetical protein